MEKFEGVEILKAEIGKKKGMVVVINRPEEIMGDKQTTGNKITRKYEPTDELHQSFKLMVHHLLASTELGPMAITEKYIKSREVITDPKLESFYVTAFTITGKDKDLSLVLKGRKVLGSGDFVDFVSNKIDLNGETSSYPFLDKLLVDLENVKGEVLEYLNGKIVPSSQLAFFDNEDEY